MSRAAVAAQVCLVLGFLAPGCATQAHGVDPLLTSDDGGPAQPMAPRGLPDAPMPMGDAGRDDASSASMRDAAAEVPIAVRFVEVGIEAGLDYAQAEVGTRVGCEGFTVEKCPFSSVHMSGGAAAGDVDGDGFVDLYVTRLTSPGIFYRNLGDGRFENATERFGLDGDPGSNGAGFADVDNDGDLDLYLTNVLRDRFALYVNQGGRFEERGMERGAGIATSARHHGFGVSFGDYDRDGFVDLHTTEWVQLPLDVSVTNHARLLRNRGASAPGYFEDTTVAAGVDLVEGPRGTRTSFTSSFADMDDDGWPDLLVVADFVGSRLFWNDADGVFTDGTLFSGVGTDQNGMGSAIGDYDGDGDLDWFVTAVFDADYQCDNVTCGWGVTGNRLYENNGARQFVDSTDRAGVRDGGWGWGAAFFDYDNDGMLDLVVANGVDFPNDEAASFRSDATKLWHNRGRGAFEELAAELGMADRGDGKGLLVLDFDADGDEDVLIVQHEGRALLYRNDGGNERSWLRVKLVGRVSNRDAFGARVSVTRARGERPIVRELIGGSHFLGQSEPVLHFGLGIFDGPVHEVAIRWPSGRTQAVDDVMPRSVLSLVE